jgi:four helix bundle protein
MVEFHAYTVALELVGKLRPIVGAIRRRDSDLAKQVRKSATSIPANVSEGNRWDGKDRLHLFRVAAGSAAELRSHLEVAEAWGYVATKALHEVRELIDRQLAMLHRLVYGARPSDAESPQVGSGVRDRHRNR